MPPALTLAATGPPDRYAQPRWTGTALSLRRRHPGPLIRAKGGYSRVIRGPWREVHHPLWTGL